MQSFAEQHNIYNIHIYIRIIENLFKSCQPSLQGAVERSTQSSMKHLNWSFCEKKLTA